MASPALRLHSPVEGTDATEAPVAAPRLPSRRIAPELIDAYWDDVDGRVGYLIALLEVERYAEALSLCATYLEGVAHALVSLNRESGEEFADETSARASDPYLRLVHPLQLVRVASSLMGLSAATQQGFSMLLETQDPQLLYEDQAQEIIHATLPASEAELVERVLWKCTVAYIIYDYLRSQSFFRREGAQTIGLGAAFYEGDSVRGFSIPELVAMLRGMIVEARARSHHTGRLPATA